MQNKNRNWNNKNNKNYKKQKRYNNQIDPKDYMQPVPDLNELKISNDGQEKFQMFYGVASGLIYGVCGPGQFSKKMANLNGYYDSLKILTTYNHTVNDLFYDNFGSIKADLFDNNVDVINHRIHTIELKNEKVFKMDVFRNVSDKRLYGKLNNFRLHESLYDMTSFLDKSLDENNEWKDKRSANNRIFKETRNMIKRDVDIVPKTLLGNETVLLEPIATKGMAIKPNENLKTYKERVQFEYRCFYNEIQMLKEMNVWMPKEFGQFIEYDINTSREQRDDSELGIIY